MSSLIDEKIEAYERGHNDGSLAAVGAIKKTFEDMLKMDEIRQISATQLLKSIIFIIDMVDAEHRENCSKAKEKSK